MTDLEPRVAVLERMAQDNVLAQRELRADMREGFHELRTDFRELRRDFRWLLTIMLGGFVLVLGAIGALGALTLPTLRALGH